MQKSQLRLGNTNIKWVLAYHTNIEGHNFISSRYIYMIFISYQMKTNDIKVCEVCSSYKKWDELLEMFGGHY